MAQIPSKQLHRSGTLEDLQANLSNREIGFCTTDHLAYYKLNGILFPMGSGIIPDPTENALFMAYDDPEHPGEYIYGWKQFTEVSAPYDERIKLWSRIAGMGLYAEVASKDSKGRKIADTLDKKTDATDMTPGTYTKVSVNEQGAVTNGGGLEASDLPPGFMFNKDPNYASNYASPHSSTDLNSYTTSYCNGQSVNVVFLNNGPNAFELNNGFIDGNIKRYVDGDYVLITNKASSLSLGVRTEGGSSDIKTIPAGSSSLFVCQYSGNETLTDNSVWVPVS